jgi:hypothetical protein
MEMFRGESSTLVNQALDFKRSKHVLTRIELALKMSNVLRTLWMSKIATVPEHQFMLPLILHLAHRQL